MAMALRDCAVVELQRSLQYFLQGLSTEEQSNFQLIDCVEVAEFLKKSVHKRYEELLSMIKLCDSLNKPNTLTSPFDDKFCERMCAMVRCTVMVVQGRHKDVSSLVSFLAEAGRMVEPQLHREITNGEQVPYFQYLLQICDAIVKNCNVFVSEGPAKGSEKFLTICMPQIRHIESTLKLAGVQALSIATQNLLQDSYQRDIIQWLSPEPLNNIHASISKRRQQGTGKWFLDEVDKWLEENQSPFLWCVGIPGAGKTVLISAAIDHAISRASSSEFAAVAYIYFNYKQHAVQKPAAVYASLVAQLYSQLAMMAPHMEDLYRRYSRTQKSLGEADFINILSGIQDPVFIAFDAIDEASEEMRNQLLRQLPTLFPNSTRVVLSARPDVDRRPVMNYIQNLDVEAHESDLEKFVRARLKENNTFQDIMADEPPEVVTAIVQDLTSNADGMFLLVVFQVRYVCEQTCLDEIQDAARSMPSDPEAIYTRILKSIDSQSRTRTDLAHKVLLWLVLAKRSLSIAELTKALAIQPNTKELNNGQVRKPALIVGVCKGLVIVDEQSSIVRLVHQTAQDHLRESLIPEIPKMAIQICITCLTYLSFDVFGSGPCTDQHLFNKRRQNFEFLTYASKSLVDHLRDASNDNALNQAIYSFLTLDTNLKSYLQVYHSQESPYYGFNKYPQGTAAFHVACNLGEKAVAVLLERQVEIDMSVVIDLKDDHGQTPLSWAAHSGHASVVESLISRSDVVLDSKDRIGATPLSRAADSGHLAVVKLLTAQNKVVADSKDFRGRTALYYAAAKGHQAIVEHLIARKDVVADGKTNWGRTPLSAAAEKGHVAVVELLANCGNVNLDSMDVDRRTPLSWAAEKGRAAVAKLLVARSDVDADSVDSKNQTPLSWAAEKGHEAVIIELLKAQPRIRINSLDGVNRTPLSRAAEEGHVAVVRLLLKQEDIEIDLKDNHDQTPLSWASEKGQVEVVKLLILRANAKLKNKRGRTPLQLAEANGCNEVVRLLTQFAIS